MKFNRRQRLGENLLYFLVWTAIVLVPVLYTLMLGNHTNLSDVVVAWQRIAPFLLIFLLHNALIAPRLLIEKHRYVAYLAVNLLTITVVFGAVALYEYYNDIQPHVRVGMPTITELPLYGNILLGFFMTSVNAAIKLLSRSLSDAQQLEELKHKNLEAEMHYLKYQINPHFFMNTLNNIHALIDIDAECAKTAVIDLSKMMRYVLYESDIQSISLKKDIRFIKNYIELMRIRYNGSVEIRFDHPATLPERVAIPPLLLIVFVENAFKHGVSYSAPSFIEIDLSYTDGQIGCVVRNSRHGASHSEQNGGIGLENVRRRLELFYRGDYSLDIDASDPAVYTVQLTLPAQPCFPALP